MSPVPGRPQLDTSAVRARHVRAFWLVRGAGAMPVSRTTVYRWFRRPSEPPESHPTPRRLRPPPES